MSGPHARVVQMNILQMPISELTQQLLMYTIIQSIVFAFSLSPAFEEKRHLGSMKIRMDAAVVKFVDDLI